MMMLFSLPLAPEKTISYKSGKTTLDSFEFSIHLSREGFFLSLYILVCSQSIQKTPLRAVR